MKEIIKYIVLFIMGVSPYPSSLWVTVEFILYIAKDKPFNWLSVWACLVSIVLLFISIFIIAYDKEIEKLRSKSNGKSRFQQKLEEKLNEHNETTHTR